MRWWACVVPVVLLFVPLVPAAPAAEKTEDPLAETRRLLAMRIDVDFTKVAADGAFEQIGKKVPGLTVAVGPDVREAGVDLPERYVGFSARRIPVSEVLDLVCGADLAWLAEPGRVRIVTRETYYADLPVVRYPVRRLLSGRAGKHTPGLAWQQLEDITQRTVNNLADPLVAPWTDGGGQARITWTGASFAVSQTRRGHERMADLLAMLSRGLGLEPQVAPPETPEAIRQALAETRGLLAQPIDLDFERTPLDKALAYVREVRPELNLVIDPGPVLAGLDLSTHAVTLKVRDMRVETALELLVGKYVAYLSRPGYVLISTCETFQQDLPVAVYPIRDLCSGRWSGWQEVIDIIQRTVNQCADPRVAAWSDEGGPAAIEFAAGVLIITQTETGHRQTSQLLQGMRTAIALSLELPSRPRAPVPPVAFPEDPSLAVTQRALRTRIDVDLKDMPLKDVLEEVAGCEPRLNIIVHPDVYYYSRLEPTNRITLKRTGVTRKALLEELFGEKHGIEGRRGYVRIMRRGDITLWPLTQVLYPVRDLMRDRGFDLVVAIQRRVNQEHDPAVAAWSDEGGPAAIEYMNYVLIVTQTREGHEQVNALLQDLRFRSRLATQLP